MAEVTRQEFFELRSLVEQTYWMSRAAVRALYGKDQVDELEVRIQRYCDPEIQRFASDTGFHRLGLATRPRHSLRKAGIVALEDLAVTSRGKVAAISGVGPRTLARLDAKLAEHGMSWAETA